MSIKNEQENSTLSATITTQINGQDTPALGVSVGLNSNLTGFNVNANILNLDACKSNTADVQQQLNDYIANTVKTKLTAMGYPIVLV